MRASFSRIDACKLVSASVSNFSKETAPVGWPALRSRTRASSPLIRSVMRREDVTM